MFTNLVTLLIVIKGNHKLPDNFFVNANQYRNVQNMKLSETGDFPYVLNLKIGAQVMVTLNTNVDDGLVNEIFVNLAHFFISNGLVKTVYLKFDDVNIGRSKMQSNLIGG